MMKITKREARRGTPKQCQAPGCTHSAGYDCELFDGYHDLLCASCAKAWGEAYDNALTNWAVDAHRVAVDYRTKDAA